MYKGYRIVEIIVRDAINPQTAVVVAGVSCGCPACENANQVQEGHSQCGLLPDDLRDDRHIVPYHENGQGWLPLFCGHNHHVDEWL